MGVSDVSPYLLQLGVMTQGQEENQNLPSTKDAAFSSKPWDQEGRDSYFP